MLPLFILGATTLMAWCGWIFVLFRFDPFTDGLGARALFYASLGLALLSSCMLGMIIYHRARQTLAVSRVEVQIMVRQSLLFVGFVLVVLNLAALRLLKWWNLLPLTFLVAIFEIFLLSIRKERHPNYATK